MNIDAMRSILEIGDVHAMRIEKSMHYLQPLRPFTPFVLKQLTDEQVGMLELLTNRFAKLQDLIGSKVFPQLLILLQEFSETQSNLDRLYKLEKIGMLPSVDDWIQMREYRNFVTHEYPEDPDLMCENLEKICSKVEGLLQYWIFLKQEVNRFNGPS